MAQVHSGPCSRAHEQEVTAGERWVGSQRNGIPLLPEGKREKERGGAGGGGGEKGRVGPEPGLAHWRP